MAEIDSDGSGELDFGEFLAWWQKQDPEAQRQLMLLQGVNFDDLDRLTDRGLWRLVSPRASRFNSTIYAYLRRTPDIVPSFKCQSALFGTSSFNQHEPLCFVGFPRIYLPT